MNTQSIGDIEYIVYEVGMLVNDPSKSFLFEDDLDYNGDLTCLHFYAKKNVTVHGYQDVRGNQYVGGDQHVHGNQYVGGYQDVGGYQNVGGYQDVRGDQYVGGDQHVHGNQDVRGNQNVRGNQDVRGNQNVHGNQYVGGNQDVGGDQDVRYIYLHLYCKWSFLIDRDSDLIKIGCKEKSESEWIEFFKNKDKINLHPDSKEYAKIESAFHIARQMKAHLVLMNKKQ